MWEVNNRPVSKNTRIDIDWTLILYHTTGMKCNPCRFEGCCSLSACEKNPSEEAVSLVCVFSDVLRGCYKDEFGIDPTQMGCQIRYGTEFYICEGSLCNNGVVPSLYGNGRWNDTKMIPNDITPDGLHIIHPREDFIWKCRTSIRKSKDFFCSHQFSIKMYS